MDSLPPLLSADELLADLQTLEAELIALHPAIKDDSTEQAVRRKIENVRLLLTDSLSALDFFHHVSSILEPIPCGHTVLYPRKRLNKKAIRTPFPFRLQAFGDSIVTRYDYRKDSIVIPKGTIVERVNDTDIQQWIRQLNSFRGGADSRDSMQLRQYTIYQFGGRYHWYQGQVDSLQLHLRSPQDSSYVLWLKPSADAHHKTKKTKTPQSQPHPTAD
ncbi:MAG: hypothetical protein AAFO94_09275 [Bacteroidota bacterium]